METKDIVETLTSSFARLAEEHLVNLAWHLQNDTPIFCGDGARSNFVSKEGYL